jgi:L-rhamnose mutarotase
MERIASITRIKPGMLEAYKNLHDGIWPDVVAAANRYNTRNFTIFHVGDYLFNYSEYIGLDYEADMKLKAAEPVIIRWKEATSSMLMPVNEENVAIALDEIFHCDF